jgi:hypothetical protein
LGAAAACAWSHAQFKTPTVLRTGPKPTI